MERQAGVLQQRVHARALVGRWPHAQERVRRSQREQQKAAGSAAQHAQNTRPQAAGQVLAGDGNRRAAQRQDQPPEQDRTLVVPPGASDFVEQRLQRAAVLGNIGHREIVMHRGPYQSAGGTRQGQELTHRQARRRRHQPNVTPMRAPKPYQCLGECQAGR